MRQLPVASYWLQVPGYRLPVSSYRLLQLSDTFWFQARIKKNTCTLTVMKYAIINTSYWSPVAGLEHESKYPLIQYGGQGKNIGKKWENSEGLSLLLWQTGLLHRCNFILYISRRNQVIMSLYFFVRYGLVSVFLIAWAFYQAIIRKRPWADLKDDVFAVLFFVAVWIGLAYLFTH
jgi:hypothetical protein